MIGWLPSFFKGEIMRYDFETKTWVSYPTEEMKKRIRDSYQRKPEKELEPAEGFEEGENDE